MKATIGKTALHEWEPASHESCSKQGVQRIVKALVLLLIVSITLPGCSSFSKQARMEHAHRKYVRKVRHEHQKEMARTADQANRPLRQPPSMSAPMTNVTLEPPPSDNVAAPAVVKDDAQPTP
jgi:hypothetical protein